MRTSTDRKGKAAPVDFDLHGLVGIRLLGAAAGDAAAVCRQLGLTPGTLTREPDVVLRFAPRVAVSSPVRYIGLDDAGFTDDAFLVLRGKHKSRVRVQIPLERIGRPCEIVCQSGLGEVPLLIDVVNLTMLAKDMVPIHASAFTYHGTGVLAAGWSQGGKTEALLAFMAEGAEYISDDWVYVSNDGRRMFGLPEPVQIWDWHLDELPQYRAALGSRPLARLRAIRWLRSMGRKWPRGQARRSAAEKLLGRVVSLLDRQLQVHVSPRKLFGDGFKTQSGTLDRLLLLVSHESPAVIVEPIDAQQVAGRIVFSLQEERSRLMSYYRKFRFAFPDKMNPLLEQADRLHRAMLARVLADKRAYAVYHPYPMNIPALFEAIRPLCDRDTQSAAAASAGHAPIEIAGR